MSENNSTIALLTDFGLEDIYVGVVKSVIRARCNADIIDLSHSVSPQNIAHAAYLFSMAYRYLPAGTVAMCVVDPGVGTDRRPIAVQWPGGYFVGPDNGWLTRVMRNEAETLDKAKASDLPTGWNVVELTNTAYFLKPLSRTFHGRDIFAPCAAALASGIQLEELGQQLQKLVTLQDTRPADAEGSVLGHVVHVDHYGNVITDIAASLLSDQFMVTISGSTIHGPADSYQQPGPMIALVGSSGYLEIAVPNGNAARLLNTANGDPVTVTTTRIETALAQL